MPTIEQLESIEQEAESINHEFGSSSAEDFYYTMCMELFNCKALEVPNRVSILKGAK